MQQKGTFHEKGAGTQSMLRALNIPQLKRSKRFPSLFTCLNFEIFYKIITNAIKTNYCTTLYGTTVSLIDQTDVHKDLL